MNNLYPQPTEDFEKAQNDLKLWGYCLLLNAIPKNLNEDAKKDLKNKQKLKKIEYCLSRWKSKHKVG